MDPIDHLKSHLTKDYLERLSSMALASAGFSAGLLLLLVESNSISACIKVSLWSAIVALMLSLYGWQYFLPYILHGESTYKQINFFHVAFLQVFIVFSLLISLTALVWQLSVYAGVALAISGFLMGVLVIRHNINVTRHCGV